MKMSEFKTKLHYWKLRVKSPDDRQALPGLIEDLVSTCPKAGNGVHLWFAKAAYQLVRWPFNLSSEEAYAVLERAALARGRKPGSNEIVDAINLVLGTEERDLRKITRAPEVNAELEAEARQYRRKGQQQLVGMSKISKPYLLSTYEILLRLFPVETRLLFNYDDYASDIFRLGHKFEAFFENRAVPQWMVPRLPKEPLANPKSLRDINNFDYRGYQVTEFDTGTLDEQASKILWLRMRKPIVRNLMMVVWSGGKSLQAWWALSKANAVDLINEAISIGADPAHKSVNQLVRTPNAFRINTQQRQSVIYLA